MSGAFERHWLDHISASSINLFVAQPAMLAMQKLMGLKSTVGPAAHRGTSIEAGVEMGLFEPDAPVEACQELAIARFNQLTALSGHPGVDKERAAIAPAVAIGLANMVVPRESLMDETLKLANRIADKSPLVLKLMKRTLASGADMAMQAALDHEQAMVSLVLDSEDAHEGCSAFLEKRKPNFKGR